MLKKSITLLFISLLSISFVYSQRARKPTIMVFPSDRYCIENGYSQTFESEGLQQTMPDYKKALQSDAQLRLVISKMGRIMADRGFPLKDLEQELKNLERESAEIEMMQSRETGSMVQESPIDKLKRVANADIILDLDFTINERGPQQWITFNLRGLDAYTSKLITSAAGTGNPSTAASVDLLLEEAVLSHMDNFNEGLMNHFEEMFEIGREVNLTVRVWQSSYFDLYEFFDMEGYETELTDIIEYWVEDHAVDGRYSLSDGSANFLKFEQIRIPLLITDPRGRERSYDTRRFARDLSRYLRQNYNIDAHIHQKGLGEAWLIIGER